MAEERHYILGAAGHVDHGKTALITALTGTHTDRLKEERERGISIELGFAELDLGEGLRLGVVDMPGHEKFVKQMVSGAGGVDLAFLVVAADESVMPQTIEHLEILDSLGTRGGIVVLTKIDMVDEDFLGVATEETRELVDGTFLEGKPIVPVSAHTGEGLEALKEALRQEVGSLPLRREEGAFRLPVDRIFTLPGAGVVVTGTCWSGTVKEGDKLVVLPTGAKVRVREVQVHGGKASRGASGQRLALALHGIKKDEVERGHQIVSPDSLRPSKRLDVRVNVMPHYQGIIKNRQRLHIHHAGREVLGRIVLLDEQELGGEGGKRTGLAQLHLESELVAARDDRLVLRFYSPVISIAGGIVLDENPLRHKRFDDKALEILLVMEDGDTSELFLQNLRAAGLAGLDLSESMGQHDRPEALRAGKRIYARDLLDELAAKVAGLLTEYARRFPLRLGIPKEEARRKCKFKGGSAEWNAVCKALAEPGRWQVAGDRIVLREEGPELSAALGRARDEALKELAGFGLNWPGLDNWEEQSQVFGARETPAEFLPMEVVRHFTDHGLAVAVNSEYLVSQASYADLLAKLNQRFAETEEMTFGEFRELSGLTRKLGIPMLEHLDHADLTLRRGDVRVAGSAIANLPADEI